MGKKSKTGKARRDKFYHLAKESGLRARSAFKLLQLNRQYDFLTGASVCIDLCAAPGGWMQVAKEAMTKNSNTTVIGVDLVPIQPIKGCISIQADITTEHCRAQLRKNMNHRKADVVLHDGAPNVGTSWIQDAFTQAELVLQSLKLATQFLRKGGTFVTKVFRSRDYPKLLYVFGKLFEKVHATKPSSSRNVSAEIFVVCQRYVAPHRIDPRLLDSRTVFSEVEPEKEEPNVLQQKEKKKNKPKPEGYEEGNYTQYKDVNVDEFIRANDFMTMLSTYSAFTFSPNSPLLKLPETTPEIKALCEDLKLLNKKDFKTLIKWRQKMRGWLRALAEEQIRRDGGDGNDDNKTDDANGNADGDEEESDEDEDDGLLSALKDAAAKERAKMKRLRKRRTKMNLKLKERLSLQMDTPQGLTDDNGTLFDLRGIRSEEQLKAVTEADDFDALQVPCNDGPPTIACNRLQQGALCNELEEQLDQHYNSYLERKNVKLAETEHKKRIQRALKGDDANADGVEGGESDEDVANAGSGDTVLVRSHKKTTSAAANRWFAQAGLDDLDLADDIDMESDAENTSGSGSDTGKRRSGAGGDADGSNGPAAKKGKSGAVGDGVDDESWAEELGLQLHKEDLEDVSDVSDTEDEEEESGDEDGEGRKKQKKKQKQKDAAQPMVPSAKKAAGDGAEEKEGVSAAATAMREVAHVLKSDTPDAAAKGGTSDDDDEKAKKKKKARKAAEENAFEEVPLEKPMAAKPSLDAEGLALATEMVVRNKRRAIIDQAYNRYAHNDGQLPAWFADEENPHMKPMKPITKEMVQQMKEYERELNARPIKKVMEAKAKRKHRLVKFMGKVNQQAAVIADNDTLTEREKVRQIEQLYKKLRAKRNQHERTKLVVARRSTASKKPTRPKGVTGRYKMVDRRMLSDKRGEDNAARRKKRKQKRKHR
ncbi:FtsJ cell division protein [Salpingoeca rosetta]|uniref:Putative rRNA methyltransferase n=1 Tax=Salpingoeca rosetta (strain ATCC 50818 / BSB-021) TaxID=946362 RepID=F2TXY7_SALR5|nr:FtsJ cell division protein [Salpingoeca rosetta]EGD76246.1 FtsJ cell division protein [Salpingoeca rosetta]|eukprot:XP_004998421.1 FtsJ cell division protein [Salpingoeca rosetta]